MRKFKTKLVSLLLAFALAIPIVSVPVKTEAASMSFPTSWNLIYGGTYSATGTHITNFPKNGKIKNIKSSDSSIAIAEAIKHTGSTSSLIMFTPKKAGKCKVEFDVVYGKKKKHFKINVTVNNYENPISSIKLNGKDYAKYLDKNARYTVKTKSKTKKYTLKIKPKKGWKIGYIYYWDGSSSKQVKNNKSFTYKKNNNSTTMPYLNISLYKVSDPNYIIDCQFSFK